MLTGQTPASTIQSQPEGRPPLPQRKAKHPLKSTQMNCAPPSKELNSDAKPAENETPHSRK